MDAGSIATSFFDVDATVAEYCRARDLAVPTEVDALIELHLEALGTWLDDVESRLGR
jgi:hypothetical protein